MSIHSFQFFTSTIEKKSEVYSTVAIFFSHFWRFAKVIFPFFSVSLSSDLTGAMVQNLLEIMSPFENFMKVIKPLPKNVLTFLRTAYNFSGLEPRWQLPEFEKNFAQQRRCSYGCNHLPNFQNSSSRWWPITDYGLSMVKAGSWEGEARPQLSTPFSVERTRHFIGHWTHSFFTSILGWVWGALWKWLLTYMSHNYQVLIIHTSLDL